MVRSLRQSTLDRTKLGSGMFDGRKSTVPSTFPPGRNADCSTYGSGPGVPPTQEDHQARFYEDYHKVAEEYDKEFLKRYDEDLNTTLIFVSPL